MTRVMAAQPTPAQQDASQRFMGRWLQVETHPATRPDRSILIRGREPATREWHYRIVHEDGIAMVDAGEAWT